MNPYKMAPLTAVILNGGYDLSDAKVTVKAKGEKGIDISYDVSNSQLLTHGGIPVFGLYADYVNKVEVLYKRNGDVRWYMKADEIRDPDNIYKKGNMMGFSQTKDGSLLWGMGQRYMKYDLALDQGAVCLNVDASKAGTTTDKEALEDPNAAFGDIAGVGSGRNWAHVNSVNYDPNDDSIVVSVRHQSAVVKITRDKKVKWILAPKVGWNKELATKLLTPVDKGGKKLDCDDNGVCENSDFDFTWTQHTAYKINEKSDKNKYALSVFDNGDARYNEQPAIPTMKYSRAVKYAIDEKK